MGLCISGLDPAFPVSSLQPFQTLSAQPFTRCIGSYFGMSYTNSSQWKVQRGSFPTLPPLRCTNRCAQVAQMSLISWKAELLASSKKNKSGQKHGKSVRAENVLMHQGSALLCNGEHSLNCADFHWEKLPKNEVDPWNSCWQNAHKVHRKLEIRLWQYW